MKLTAPCRIALTVVLCCLFYGSTVNAFAAEVKSDTRCTVCGMFVAKYPAWISKITLQDGKKKYFDGVKDMLFYYFNPEKYGVSKENSLSELGVKDYYSLAAFDAKKAFYVVGSDVYGPMGHEFIPFSSVEAAKAFMKDHHGKEILTFEQITAKRVESLRSGHKMK